MLEMALNTPEQCWKLLIAAAKPVILCQFVCVSVCLCVSLFVCVWGSQPVCVSVCLSVCPWVSQAVCLSVRLSVPSFMQLTFVSFWLPSAHTQVSSSSSSSSSAESYSRVPFFKVIASSIEVVADVLTPCIQMKKVAL